jgi:hypothetical protein
MLTKLVEYTRITGITLPLLRQVLSTGNYCSYQNDLNETGQFCLLFTYSFFYL